MSHEVSVDPVDDAGIDISDLEQRWNLGVSSTAIDPNPISHPPAATVINNHRHACCDVQENGIRLGRCNGACMVIRETIGWRLQEPSEENIAPVMGWPHSDEAMAAAK